jgi:hypothetical protein
VLVTTDSEVVLVFQQARVKKLIPKNQEKRKWKRMWAGIETTKSG